jgi:molybdopterin-guanine dinucleotide biosynthesis protein A
MPELTAFVLAGGRSSRMGTEKALLKLDGETLLARALALARDVAPDVRIVGSKSKFGQFAPVVEDIYPDQGPLAGIHAALNVTPSQLNLVLAVDLPFLEKKFLEYLVAEAHSTRAVVTVPRASGGYQPLCAVYHRDFGRLAETALASGQNKIDSLFAGIALRIIDEHELKRFAFSPAMFDNLNTREDWNRARAHRSQKP